MITLVEYFKRTGKIPRKSFVGDKKPNASKILEEAFKLPPEEAVNYLKAKSNNIVDQETFDKLDSESKDKAFTVAKIASADMLSDFLNLVTKAKEESWDLKKFKENALNLGQKAWSTKSDGYIGNRLNTIYNTNMTLAYQSQKFKSQQLLGKQGIAEYIQWMPSSANDPDPLHKEFYYKVFRYDDPFLKKHYPGCRWGCQCWTRSLTSDKIKSDNLQVSSGAELFKSFDNGLKDLFINDTKNSLNLVAQWEPEVTKYVDKIKNDLIKALENFATQKRNLLPDCDWAFKFSNTRGKDCLETENKTNWEKLNLKSVKDIPIDELPQIKANKAIGKTVDDQIKLIMEKFGLNDTFDSIILKSPIGDIKVDYTTVEYLIKGNIKNNQHREAYIDFFKNTIEKPFEIWKTYYPNFKEYRNRVIGLYWDDKAKEFMFVVIRINEDGSLLFHTAFGTDAQYIDNHRNGELLYQKNNAGG
jgi:hypothetical protein